MKVYCEHCLMEIDIDFDKLDPDEAEKQMKEFEKKHGKCNVKKKL